MNLKKIVELQFRHKDIFGYFLPNTDDIIFGDSETLERYIDALKRSARDKKDYVIGNFGITEERVRIFNRPAESIIWD